MSYTDATPGPPLMKGGRLKVHLVSDHCPVHQAIVTLFIFFQVQLRVRIKTTVKLTATVHGSFTWGTGAVATWQLPVGVSQGPAIRHSKNKLLSPRRRVGLVISGSLTQCFRSYKGSIMPSENCQRRHAKGNREMSQPVPQARQWESLKYLEKPCLTQRGTGAGDHRCGAWEAMKQYIRAVLTLGAPQEVKVLLRGQAGMGRSGGERQQGGRGREQQGREENQWGDRGIRFRRENKRQWGLSCTLWLIC